jgi:hypothetical protein
MLAWGGSRALSHQTGFTDGAKPERRSVIDRQSISNRRYPVPLGRGFKESGQVRNEAAITFNHGV